ncbi:hypothetical protein [Nitratiruptor tergarcus]|nr:hypothetical protein [Nitratiruptor tergarcus]
MNYLYIAIKINKDVKNYSHLSFKILKVQKFIKKDKKTASKSIEKTLLFN